MGPRQRVLVPDSVVTGVCGDVDDAPDGLDGLEVDGDAGLSLDATASRRGP